MPRARPPCYRAKSEAQEPRTWLQCPSTWISRRSRTKLKKQFTGLDPNDPSLWPALPRNLLYCGRLRLAVIAGLWFAWLKSVDEELIAEKTREEQLREDYKKKLVQAVNLDALKKQLEQVQQYVTQLERQLPSKAEMDALLSDINQAGIGRSLQFELFRPGQELVKEYYVELPIAVRVTGRYHDMGACLLPISPTCPGSSR